MTAPRIVSNQFVRSYPVDMKLSVTLIARNEESNLARLLPQLSFADEVITVDTGSDDGTRAVAEKYGAVFDYKWKEDFSAARNYAISRASGDYIMWLDADDILPVNTQKTLMGWKKSSPTADFYYLRYRMDGDFPFWFWRERVVRNCSACRFRGFIHEAIAPFGKTAFLDCEVVHRPSGSHEKRNLAIYRHAVADGKRLGLRDKYYFARTLLENGLVDEALPLLRAFAGNARASAVDRADAYKLLARYAAANDGDKALAYLSRSTRLMPPSGEVCCMFGQIYFDRRNYVQAAEWYRLALASRSGAGFVNEYYTGFLPNVQLSVCMWNLGDAASARDYHNAARAIAPSHPTVTANDVFFR